MPDLERFAVLVVVASVVFLAVLGLVTRGRSNRPRPGLLFLLTFVVVLAGMVFARYGHILFRLPWWIYYGLPASLTFLLPPVALRMRTAEIARYVPLAVLMGPGIHLLASLVFGWHDYMPFPVYIPSLMEMVHRFV